MNEKFIEEAFKKWWRDSKPKEWKLLDQQADIGIGVIDLLYWNFTWDHAIIVEIKKGKAPKDTLAQLMAYMGHITEATNTGYKESTSHLKMDPLRTPHGFIVAQDLDRQTLRAVTVNSYLHFVRYFVKDDHLSFIEEWLYPTDRKVYEMELIQFMRKRIADREEFEHTRDLRWDITNPNTLDEYEILSIAKTINASRN